MANNFAIEITAVDRATAVFKKVNEALGKFSRPITNTQKSLAALGKETGLSTLTKRLGATGSAAVKAAEKLGALGGTVGLLAGAGSIGGLASLARQWGDMGLQATNAAYRIGLGTQQLQQFQSAARLGGASADAMSQGVANMAKNIGDALSNRNPAMAGFAQQLGIRFRYGPDGKADVATAYKDLKAALDKAPTAHDREPGWAE
jgi:hypothetical protein